MSSASRETDLKKDLAAALFKISNLEIDASKLNELCHQAQSNGEKASTIHFPQLQINIYIINILIS